MKTIERDIVGAFIFSNDNHVLLGTSSEGGVYMGIWTVPGGGIEAGETQETALRREVLEEVGVDIADYKLMPIGQSQNGESEKTINSERMLVKMTFYDFRVDIPKSAKDIPATAGDDFANVKWVPFKDLKDLPITSSMIKTFKKFGYL